VICNQQYNHGPQQQPFGRTNFKLRTTSTNYLILPVQAQMSLVSLERQKFSLNNFLTTFLVFTVSPTPNLTTFHLYAPLYLVLSGVSRFLHRHLRPSTFKAFSGLSPSMGLFLPRDGAILPTLPVSVRDINSSWRFRKLLKAFLFV